MRSPRVGAKLGWHVCVGEIPLYLTWLFCLSFLPSFLLFIYSSILQILPSVKEPSYAAILISKMAQNTSHMFPYTATNGYQIPDITFRDPKNRKLKVLTIGAGVSGIMMAYQIQKQCQKSVIFPKDSSKHANVTTVWNMSSTRRTKTSAGLGLRIDILEQPAMFLHMLTPTILP